MLDKDLNIKIADFTFAQCNDTGISGGIYGSEFYRAPEICRKQCPYDGEKADVFALAIVLFACAMKRFPTLRYKWIINTPEYQKFCEDDQNYTWPLLPKVSDDFKDLFTSMFKEDPKDRISLEAISKHPWVTVEDLPSEDELNAVRKKLEEIRQG